MHDSATRCDRIIDVEAKSNNEETKSVPTNFNEKNLDCQTHIFFILIAFLFIRIALLISVSIYCYKDKRSSKTKIFISISGHK